MNLFSLSLLLSHLMDKLLSFGNISSLCSILEGAKPSLAPQPKLAQACNPSYSGHQHRITKAKLAKE